MADSSPSSSSQSDGESESHQTDEDSSIDSSPASSCSSTSVLSDEPESHQTDDDSAVDSSPATSGSSTMTLATEGTQHDEESDNEDAVPKSPRVITTNFISNEFTYYEFFGKRSKSRGKSRETNKWWNCCCDLLPALRNIEGSPEAGGIALAIVAGHGFMHGDEQYLKITKKSKCKRCVSPIPLSKVMAALHSAQKNTVCVLFAGRVQNGPESEYDSSFPPSSLATRFVSLLMPGSDSTHADSTNLSYRGVLDDLTRRKLLKTFNEGESVREAMEYLHGKFVYEYGEKVTPIEVIMHKDWMRNDEMNEDGVSPKKRSRMEELPPHEKLQTLFAKYKIHTSHENRCLALKELRSHVAMFWDEITATQPYEFKKNCLDKLLQALTTETNAKLRESLLQVVAEAALCSIDQKTGFQKTSRIGRFIESSLTGSFSLKMAAISILTKVPNLFGQDINTPVCLMKATLNDTNMRPFAVGSTRFLQRQRTDIESAAIRCLFAFLNVQKPMDLSPFIPILIQRAEERMINAENFNEFYLISSFKLLVRRFPHSFTLQSVISIVNKGLQSSANMKVKEILMESLVTRDYDWIEIDRVSMTNIFAIIRYCASSNNTILKKFALEIYNGFPAICTTILTANPTATTEFFEKIIEDDDENIFNSALSAYLYVINHYKNDETLESIPSLIPLIQTFIKLAAEKYCNSEWNLYGLAEFLNRIFFTYYKKCSASLGKDGLSVMFKHLTEIVAASYLIEEKARCKKDESLIQRQRLKFIRVITVLTEKGEMRAEFVQLIKNSVVSTNSSLKKTTLDIFSNAHELLEYREALSFFEKILNDDDDEGRWHAACHFVYYTERHFKSNRVNEDSNKDLFNLLPVIVEIFSTLKIESDENKEKALLIRLIKACPTVIATEHGARLVKCFMQMSIEHDEETDEEDEEEDQSFDQLNPYMDQILIAPKETNVLQTAINVVHSSIQNKDWKTRYAGLNGLVVISKHGHGSMNEHLEKMTSLLTDDSPRVRSLACLALGQMECQSEVKKEIHEMIIPHLISSLNDASSKVGAHAAKVLRKLIDNCSKEILLFHLNSLIDATFKFAQKKVNRIEKTNDFAYCKTTFGLLFVTLKAAEESIVPFYDKLMTLFKNCLLNRRCATFIEHTINCVSLIGRAVDQERFKKDVDEIILSLISSLNNISSQVRTHALDALRNFIDICPKEILISHLKSLIDATCKFSKKEMYRYHAQIIKLLIVTVKAADEATAPLYDKAINLLKKCLKFTSITVDKQWSFENQQGLIDLTRLVYDCSKFIAKKHGTGLVECCIHINTELNSNGELYERTHCLHDFIYVLKETNALQTAVIVAHSFMQNANWEKRFIGLNALFVIAKEGYGLMEEHIEKMTTILKDPIRHVRSLACLALGEITSHIPSEIKEGTHKMIIIPLISTLNDEIPKVGYHAAKAIFNFIGICPKEILLSHLNPLIENTLDFAQKEMQRAVKSSVFDYCDQIFKLLLVTLTAAEESIAPFYVKIITLFKNLPEKCFNGNYDGIPMHSACAFDCITFLGNAVGKETFNKDIREMLRLFAGCKYEVIHGIARWCEIVGSEFSPLLPLVINVIVKAACSVKMRSPMFYFCSKSRSVGAAETLTSIATTLGEKFAPHVEVAFKAAQQHLKFPEFDYDCWAGYTFFLLLSSLDSQGVNAKRKLWVRFWPEFKQAVKVANTNHYSTKAIMSITRVIVKLGSEGVSEEMSEEIVQWIEGEVYAFVMRREWSEGEYAEENDEDFEVALYEKMESDFFGAIDELAKILEDCLNGVPPTEPIVDEGVEKMIIPIAESSDNIHEESNTASV